MCLTTLQNYVWREIAPMVEIVQQGKGSGNKVFKTTKSTSSSPRLSCTEYQSGWDHQKYFILTKKTFRIEQESG